MKPHIDAVKKMGHWQYLTKIYESSSTVLMRGIQGTDQRVIIKTPSKRYVTHSTYSQYQHEFNLLKACPSNYVVQPVRLALVEDRPVLVLEDGGYMTLHDLRNRSELSIYDKWHIALQLVQGLEAIHQHGVFHRDINPSNIVIHPERWEPKYIDFANAAFRSNPQVQEAVFHDQEVTLGYVSPEQTGRMGGTVDYRTDFYSLGVTLYELFTGQLPYPVNDVMTAIHSHMAKPPLSPSKIDDNIPEAISRVILKCLEKSPVQRYKSAQGLKADLLLCMSPHQQHVKLDSPQFQLGDQDQFEQLVISSELVGREEEERKFSDMYDHVRSGGSGLVLVNGETGVGKTRLLHAFTSYAKQHQGRAVFGGAEPGHSETPLALLISVMNQLLDDIIDLDDPDKKKGYIDHIQKAVGPNGQILNDLLPKLHLLWGEQSEMASLSWMEAQARFHYVLARFLRVFVPRDQPLVICLDQLQWADTATLAFIRYVLHHSDCSGVLLVMAYRDECTSQPLHDLLQDLQKPSLSHVWTTCELTLRPLDSKGTSAILQQSLNLASSTVAPLAAYTHRVTKGNPLFIQQLIHTLYERAIIYYSSTSHRWEWDLSQPFDVTLIRENVIDVLIDKFSRLSEETQYVLAVGACVGASFTKTQIQTITDLSEQQIITALNTALDQGLLKHRYDFVFAHEKLHQVAYESILQEDRDRLHYLIASNYDRAPLTQGQSAFVDIFSRVNHLNQSTRMMKHKAEQQDVAELNLLAAEEARRVAAFQTALHYYLHGCQLIDDHDWQHQSFHDVAFMLHLGKAEALYINGQYDEAERTLAAILQKVTRERQIFKVYQVKIDMYTWMTRYTDVLALSRKVLGLVGFSMRHHVSRLASLWEDIKVRVLMRGRTEDKILNLPLMSHPKYHEVIKVLHNCGPAAYYTHHRLFGYINAKVVSFILKYGLSPDACIGFASYGTALVITERDLERGYKFGRIGCALADKMGDPYGKNRAYGPFGIFINHWMHHAKSNMPYLLEGYQAGLESGNTLYASYCAVARFDTLLFCGTEIDALAEELQEYHQRTKNNETLDRLMILHDFMDRLQHGHEYAGHASLDHHIMDSLSHHEADKQGNQVLNLFLAHLYHAQWGLIYRDYTGALKNILKADSYTHSVLGQVVYIDHLFYKCMLLAIDAQQQPTHDKKMMMSLKKGQKTFKQWARRCPANFDHKYWLIKAERYRVAGKANHANRAYMRAVSSAREYGFKQHVAIAYERLADLYQVEGEVELQDFYLQKAYDAYLRWGAKGKAEALLRQSSSVTQQGSDRGQLGQGQQDQPPDRMSVGETFKKYKHISSVIDYETVLKVTQTISSEIQLERLLHRLLHITLENAGANKAIILLKTEDRWTVKASGESDEDDIHVRVDTAAHDTDSYPMAVVQHVIQTGKPSILNDIDPTRATDSNIRSSETDAKRLSHDPYFIDHQVSSCLCLPIKRGGMLSAILYVENQYNSHAFSAQRIEMLNMMLTQAAISLEHARLYAELDQMVQDRTYHLEQAMAKLKDTQRQLIESEKMAALGQLVSGMAHEINTPLGIAITASSYLQQRTEECQAQIRDIDRLSDSEQGNFESFFAHAHESTRLILSNLQRATTLMDSFKQMSVDQVLEEKRTFHLLNYITKILSTLKPKIEKSGHQIEVHGDEHLTLYEDPGAFSQIITNLVINSIEHAYDEGQHGSIQIEIQRDKAYGRIIYQDDGKGIESKYRNKIFEPFFTTNRHNGGTGLGLNLVYNIVTQKLAGQISCQSEVDRGTTFIIKIPIVREQETITTTADHTSKGGTVQENMKWKKVD
ncbi:trifunctional serine/threonine-protein kinase/ATP-binding protein/sensor histidine kinase [Caldalkalibacillus salinus]|uniref:trifunctional serine/threonine-protein kinase/ATP-binding protein/sensor histidine kinase n=1 Tax=Caldalkalibacillus salinus TaxID=2803787 RepID=UPI0019211DC6|nr:AAA family ATPase [Caldalkalibacillus salinus]